MGRQGGHTHGHDRPFGAGERSDGRQELLGSSSIHDPQDGMSAWSQPQGPLSLVLWLLVAFDQPTTNQSVNEPAGGRWRPADGLSQLPYCQGAAVRQHIESGQLRKAETQLTELTGKPDDQLAPEGPTHRHPLADLTNVGQTIAGGQHRRRQVRLEPSSNGADRSRAAWHRVSVRGVRNICNAACESRSEASWPPTLLTMTSVAFVFPGQGSQSVGMGRLLADFSADAAAVFAAADQALGSPISNLAWNGPAEQLDRTENAQPALLATSMAILAALRERWAAEGLSAPSLKFLAGHSMGQYSALVAAGALSLDDGLRLVRERGRLMQASGQGRDGAMAALIGLDDGRLPELVAAASTHGVFVVANRNAPGQVVVSGERAAIEAGAEIARSMGAKRAIVLPVSVAAHSPLMAEAADGMRRALASVEFHDPSPSLLANADGHALMTAENCRAELVEHLTAGVDWIRIVEQMTAAGVTTFVEVGPGRVLTGLIKRIVPTAEVIPTDDPASAGRLLELAAMAA